MVTSPHTPLDIIGSFWPATRPERRVPGRLTFDHDNGRRLELCGTFHDLQEVIDKALAKQEGQVPIGISELLGLDSPPIRILGDTTEGRVTLDRCLGAQSTYHVPLVFRGAHFLDNEPLQFEAARFDILHIEKWIGKSSLDRSSSVRKDSNQVEQIHIFCTPVGDTTVEMPSGQLRLAFEYQLSGDHIVESTIKQNCVLELRFTNPVPIDEVFEIHDALQALISIGVSAPVRVEARVRSVDRGWVQVQGSSFGTKDDRNEVRNVRPFDRLFTYDDLGGLSGIGLWLTKSKKFRLVIGLLMSRWNAPNLYGELQFFNMVTAAETFARIQCQKQNFDFSKKLKMLANNAGAPFRSVVDDVSKWANLVVRIRNNNVVHRGLRNNPDGEVLYWLTGSLYILVVLCLLRECKVPEENLPNPETCPWIATVARKLRKDR